MILPIGSLCLPDQQQPLSQATSTSKARVLPLKYSNITRDGGRNGGRQSKSSHRGLLLAKACQIGRREGSRCPGGKGGEERGYSVSGSTRSLPSWGLQPITRVLPPSLLRFSAVRNPTSSDDGCRAVVGDRGTQLDCGKGVGTSGRGKETGSHQEICKDHARVLLTKQRLFSPAGQPPPRRGGKCDNGFC